MVLILIFATIAAATSSTFPSTDHIGLLSTSGIVQTAIAAKPSNTTADIATASQNAIVNRVVDKTEKSAGSAVHTSDISTLTRNNNQFALKFYSDLIKSNESKNNNNSNIFFSPWSIYNAFGLVYEGAKQKTAKEIQSVFGFPINDTNRRSAFEAIQNDLSNNTNNNNNNNTNNRNNNNANQSSSGNNYTLDIANALWLHQGYNISKNYLDISKQYYHSNITNVNFAKSQEAASQINNWVESKTNNKIKEMIKPGEVNNYTLMVITNAVYFKGKWVTQFDKNNTTSEDFHINQNKTVKVPMMKIQDAHNLKYAETKQLQILEMPYQGKRISMLILLPRNGVLPSLLSANNISQWRNQLKDQFEITVHIPKFTLNTEYDLISSLVKMGMPSAFNSSVANFSGITQINHPYISKALHKAFVNVTEEGTEAAAATAIAMVGGVQNPPVFTADHPFIFIIQDNKTGNILFMGRVVDPTKS